MKPSAEAPRNEQKRNYSLKTKWTIGAAIALFLMYTFFSLILFVSFREVMLTNEEQAVKQTAYYITNRLSLKSSNLTEDSVKRILDNPDPENNSMVPSPPLEGDTAGKLETGKSNLFQDNLNTQLNKRGTIIRVYDPNMKLIYAPTYSSVAFSPAKQLYIKEIGTKNGMALTAISPVYTSIGNRLIGYVQIIDQLNEYHKLSQNILWTILFTGLLALLFSALAGYIIASQFLKPIKKVTEAMKSIEKDPLSHARIDISDRNDELSEMGSAYNNMMDRMQRNIENQKEFVEDVSHELRTPVAVVEGHLKLLNRWGKDDPEILEESLEASLQEIGRMKTLVQEMLDISRAEQVEIHYKHELTAVKEVIRQTFNNFEMIHPDFEFNLDNDLKEDVCVNIYRNHLEQILIIIMDNAVKYSTKRKEIHVSTAVEKGEVHIAIQDFGEGMTQEDTERIFNRFYRIDKARARVTGGSGLGLSIAQELIHGYKGRIWAESVLNHGSIFRIVLPIKTREELESEQEEADKNDLLTSKKEQNT